MEKTLEIKSRKEVELAFWKAHGKKYFLHFSLLLASTFIIVPILLPLYFKVMKLLTRTMTNETYFTIVSVLLAFITLYLIVFSVGLITYKVTKSVLANQLNLKDKQLKTKCFIYHLTRIAPLYFLITYLFIYLIIALSL